MPALKKQSSLRVLRRDFPRPDGSAVAIFAVLWNERDAGDSAALDRILSRTIESGATILRTEDGAAKKRFAPDHILEYVARTTNAAILREIDIEQISRIPRVHAVVAACYRNEIALIGHGAVHAFLFREEKRKNLATDLLHLDEKKEGKPQSRNFFSEFVSGTIRADDVVILGANTLLDYLSLEHLGALTAGTTHPEEAVQKIGHLVSDTNGMVPFGEVILRHANAPIAKQVPKQPAQSIQKFLNTQEETKQYLNASVLSFLGRVLEGKPKQSATSEPKPPQPAEPRGERTKSGLLLGTWIKRIKLRVPRPSRKSFKALRAIRAPAPLRTAHHTALSWFVERFNHFPARAKIIFPLVLLGVILFVQSIILVQKKVAENRARRSFESQVALVREKVAAAEANRLYGNEDGAHALIEEIKPLMQNLAAPDPTLEHEFQTVHEEVKKIVNRLARLEVPVLKKVATLPSAHAAMAVGKYGVVVLDRPTGSVSIVKPGNDEQTPAEFARLPESAGWTSLVPASDHVVLAVRDGALATVSLKDKKISPLSIDPKMSVADAAIWNKRLYRLGSDGKIFRHDRAGDGFASGASWLKDEAVTDAKDMEIDSAIYVLGGSGTITKYLGGKKQTFALPALDVPWGGPTRMKTWADSEVLAMLDPPTGRIIFVSAAGKLMKQYEEKTVLGQAADFAIDPVAKTIYVASEAAVYSFQFDLKKQ